MRTKLSRTTLRGEVQRQEQCASPGSSSAWGICLTLFTPEAAVVRDCLGGTKDLEAVVSRNVPHACTYGMLALDSMYWTMAIFQMGFQSNKMEYQQVKDMNI
jgi:hypothetical protein